MIQSQRSIQNRRRFLKAAGVAIGLPALESIPVHAAPSSGQSGQPRRMVCIGNSFGMYQPAFFPKEAGKHYKMTTLLKPIEKHRNDFTVFSNLDHGVKGGHFAVHSFLSGVKQSQASNMPDGNISMDQRIAEAIGSETRFPSLVIGSTGGLHGGTMMSWTRTGVRVPPIPGPRQLFNQLFVAKSQEGVKKEAERYKLKHSILDAVMEEAGSLKKRVSGQDKEKLDEYFTSVRDVERKISQQQKWLGAPYPKPPQDLKKPANNNLVDDIPELYELIAIALETDSSRTISLELAGSNFNTGLLGINKGYHALSHHGRVQESIDALVKIETYQMAQFSTFLDLLKSRKTSDGQSLFDHTAVLFGSGLGNANAHTNSDLPIIVAGGGYKLGEHRIMPKASNRRVPLSNLFLSLIQRMGVEDTYFAKSSGTLTGLEMA